MSKSWQEGPDGSWRFGYEVPGAPPLRRSSESDTEHRMPDGERIPVNLIRTVAHPVEQKIDWVSPEASAPVTPAEMIAAEQQWKKRARELRYLPE
jgi:hypothetical protein